MQLIRWIGIAALVAGLGARARADDDAPAPAPSPTPAPTTATPAPAPAPTPTPAPAPTPTAPTEPTPVDPLTTSDPELRDVFAEGYEAPEDPDAAPEAAPGEPPTGTVRLGGYADSDCTSVLRAFGTLAQTFGRWKLSGSVVADAVTSASVDVRSSPALSKIDVVTSASGRSSTSGGQMTDSRYQATGNLAWNDTSGHAATVTTSVAHERDYKSASIGLNGSYDLDDRTFTLLGGASITDNWISSVLMPTLHRKMLGAAWSVGLARVVTRDDAIRLRYDGKLSDGYQASPYRNVRFGDWIANQGIHQITFTNTIGSADGLLEKLPQVRVGHAAVLEWVHSLSSGVGLHSELRGSHDSWSIDSASAGIDLRIARPAVRFELGYRFYLQSRADFYESKYTEDPSMYTYYTSDKELGEQYGHLGHLSLAWRVFDPERPDATRMWLGIQLEVAHYNYPGFLLLPSRSSVFVSVGPSWDL